jgi:hypothetical protein
VAGQRDLQRCTGVLLGHKQRQPQHVFSLLHGSVYIE